MSIEQIQKEILRIERKIEKTEDVQELIALKKEKIKLETKLIELTEKELGTDHSEGVMSLKEAIALAESMAKKPKYESGVAAIDKHLGGGFEMAQMVVIAGEKGAGKTMLTMQILKNVSHGYRTMLFSLEMPFWKIVERFKKQRLSESILDNLNITDRIFTLEGIEAIIKLEASKGTRFFVIDSLMKIQTLKNFQKINERYSHISNTISRLAVELDVVIFLVAQMSKEDINHNRLALKNSGDVEYDADIIFYLKKDKNVQAKRILVCDKNRQTGEEFKETLYVNKHDLELAPDHIEVVYQSGGEL